MVCTHAVTWTHNNSVHAYYTTYKSMNQTREKGHWPKQSGQQPLGKCDKKKHYNIDVHMHTHYKSQQK